MRTLVLVPVAVIAAVVGSTIPATGSAEIVTAASAVSPTDSCLTRYTQVAQLRYIRAVYHRPSVSKRARRKIRRMASCSRSEEARANVRRLRARQGRSREERARAAFAATIWARRWKRLPAGDRAWAVSTANCESGMNSQAVSRNGDHGAMQFKIATAVSAGFVPADPKLHTLREQLVRGVWWMRRAGRGQWPVCG